LRGIPARLGPARLVSNGDEKCCHVFTMLPSLGEGWAGTIGLNALGREIDTHRVRVGIRSLDAAVGAGVLNLYVFDDPTPSVVEAPQERSCAEQPAKSAVAER